MLPEFQTTMQILLKALNRRLLGAIAAALLLLVIPSLGHTASKLNSVTLEYLGDQIFPTDADLNGVPIGGISGLAWNETHQRFYAISDDRGRFAPARFYQFTAEIVGGKLQIHFLETVFLKDSSGALFPLNTIDPEAITILPSGNLLISSEPNPGSLPRLLEFRTDGLYVRDWNIPARFISLYENGDVTYGTRTNLGFEALRYIPQLGAVIAGAENALVQDGEVASLGHGSNARLVVLPNHQTEFTTDTNYKEFVFPVSAIPEAPPEPEFLTRGLVEIITYADKLFAVERSYINEIGNTIFLYQWNVDSATNVKDLETLRETAYSPVQKELLLDFSDIVPQLSPAYRRLDNIESMAVGPTFSDGSRLLLFASDNNFSENQATQFLAFRLK